jgi:hypothetical protein
MANKILEENMKEMQRRREVSENISDTSFPKHGTCNLPLKIPGQNIVLFSTSHIKMYPSISEPDDPAVKFYGIFPDNESAQEYINEVGLRNINLQLHPTQEWGVLVSQEDHLNNEYINEKKNNILNYYLKQREELNAEFDNNVGSKSTGENTLEPIKPASSSSRFDHKNTLRGMKKISGLGNVNPIYGQKYFVVSFLPDPLGTVPELLFTVHGAFDTQSDADLWIRHVLSEYIKDVDIDIVNSCQWLFPQKIQGKDFSEEKFRGEELNNVMHYHKSEPSKIKQFDEWNKTQDTIKSGSSSQQS